MHMVHVLATHMLPAYHHCTCAWHTFFTRLLHSAPPGQASCLTRDTLESLGESQPSKPTAKGMVSSDCVCLCCIFCPAGLPAGRRLHLRTQRPGVLAAPGQVGTAAARAACCALNPGSKLLCACCVSLGCTSALTVLAAHQPARYQTKG
jgi:hypothetical protein